MPATVAACTIVAASLLLPAISVGASPPTRADGARPGARGAGASAGARAAVVGGQTSSIQDIPFQVTLYDPQVLPGPGEVANPVQSQYCGGVILDALHVITAGHCVMNQEPHGVAGPGQIEVLAGTNDINTADGQPPGYVEDPVSRTSFDPLWEPVSDEHDIGLLTLSRPLWAGPTPAIDGNHTIAPIPLASTLPPAGSTLTVSGWGYDKELAGGARPSEEVGFQRYLQSTQIPLVAQGACEQDYRAVGRTAPPGTVCAGSAGHGPCYSDSGGPLFTGPPTPPGTYALLGVVDTGYGCAQASYPVIFQSVLDANNLRFVSSNPPQAPLEQAPPTISGDPEPGHALACNPGSWSANPTYTYRFYSDQTTPSTPDAHTALTSLSPTDTYTLSAADAGRRILCEARATNAGGYNFDISQDLTVAGTLYTRSAGEPPPAAAPTLTIVSKNCQHRRCVVNVRASQGTGAAAVVAVKATLGFKRWRPCRRRRSGRSRCLRTFERRLRAQAIPAAHFVIRTGRLSAGRYELSLLAIDRAGVRQTRATVVGLTVGRTGRGHR